MCRISTAVKIRKPSVSSACIIQSVWSWTPPVKWFCLQTMFALGLRNQVLVHLKIHQGPRRRAYCSQQPTEQVPSSQPFYIAEKMVLSTPLSCLYSYSSFNPAFDRCLTSFSLPCFSWPTFFLLAIFSIHQQITPWLKTGSASHFRQNNINKSTWTLLLLLANL